MQLGNFICQHMEEIFAEWQRTARALGPPADRLSIQELRDHLSSVMRGIAEDLAGGGQGSCDGSTAHEAARLRNCSQHGLLRRAEGFNLDQVIGEYRLLRSLVTRRWHDSLQSVEADHLTQLLRFNDSLDEAIGYSVIAYCNEVEQTREMFLAILGHELCAPLSSLNGSLEMISGPSATPAQISRATAIGRRSVLNMQAQLAELREYNRARLGKSLKIALKVEDLSALCRDWMLDIGTANPGAVLAAKIAAGIRCSMDAVRIRQVLTNLIDNALKYGDAATPVEVRLQRRGEMIELAVRNQGPPIPVARQSVIFDPLIQLASKTSGIERHRTGLGLGLFIAREIALGHGGTISVDSSQERGTVFTLRLPSSAKGIRVDSIGSSVGLSAVNETNAGGALSKAP